MSKKYETVRKYYVDGVWSIKRVRDAVAKAWITPEEFQAITGQKFQ